ncbi:uncharacterized protein L201_007499 [Kwoniella dendrophila CBS 6074]|uniref:Uncharacterized protein n=1 Tax=Kwoniella dendrophila CBS 6074 TaxID=1295534 RepID=A0AAX4K6V2_9TREE
MPLSISINISKYTNESSNEAYTPWSTRGSIKIDPSPISPDSPKHHTRRRFKTLYLPSSGGDNTHLDNRIYFAPSQITEGEYEVSLNIGIPTISQGTQIRSLINFSVIDPKKENEEDWINDVTKEVRLGRVDDSLYGNAQDNFSDNDQSREVVERSLRRFWEYINSKSEENTE